MNYLFLVLGLMILVKGADYLIEGSASLAKRLKIPTFIVGLTVVAFGTSLPELIVSIFSASLGSSDVAIGNVIGSNIANILLVIGVAAMIMPLKISYSTVWKEIPFSIGAIVLLFVLANIALYGQGSTGYLTIVDGIIILGFFAYYIYCLYRSIVSNQKSLNEGPEETNAFSVNNTVIFIVVGIVGLVIGGKLTVDSSISIAKMFGMSDFLISATVIAIGTSAPELITSIRATMHKNADLAVGNIIGSNIINILLVLGLTSTIWGVALPQGINFDMIFLILASVLLLVFLFIGKKYELKKWQGFIFILAYIGYLCFIVMRG